MPENYGRRKDDVMPDDLTPDVLNNLTDSQKVHIKLLQNMNSINTLLNEINHDVAIHNRILITGNGEPSLQERVRNIKDYIDAQKYWWRFIGGALIMQTITLFVSLIVAVAQFLPLLKRLADQP